MTSAVKQIRFNTQMLNIKQTLSARCQEKFAGIIVIITK